MSFGTINCLRCQRPCRTGTPDPKARAIVAATTSGFCSNCMLTWFLLCIEPIRDLIEGTPERGGIVPAREALGPEILLGGGEPYHQQLRTVIGGVLRHTQMPEDSIDYIEVVGNWGLPWPKGKAPEVGAVF